MSKIRSLVLVAFLACGWGIPGAAMSQESDKSILGHYKGTWDCEFTIVPQTGTETAKTFRGLVIGKWVVGDQFMEQTGSYRLNETAEPLVIRTLMSFDKEQKRFHYVYFDSGGGIQTSFGKWNSASKTMTSTRRDAKLDHVTTIVADFSQDGVEKWTIETKDSQGKTLTKIKGTNTRRKTKDASESVNK